MAQQTGFSDEGLQNRIAIAEELLKKIISVHVSTATHVQSLDEKLKRIDITAATISTFVRKIEALDHDPSAMVKKEIAAIQELLVQPVQQLEERLQKTEERLVQPQPVPQLEERLQKTEELVALIHQQMTTLLEQLAQTQTAKEEAKPDTEVVDKLNQLSCVPDLFNKFESQQSTIIKALEKRTDPRLMIYLKPLIEMLEEEGRQAEQMKDTALKQLMGLLSGEETGTNQQISQLLQNVGKEIEKCQASFERTQQALQIVITPFQNVGRLFRDNLEIIVQVHDMMAQLHGDLPRFLDEMKAMHTAHMKQ